MCDDAGVTEKEQRQRQILDLLSRNRIESQDELQDLLFAEGVQTAQSTLSRDLREMGVVKGSTGYRMPLRDPKRPDRLPALSRAIGPRLASVDCGGNLVVLRLVGGEDARDVAARIERTGLHQTVAALACDGAVLVVVRTQAYARELVQGLRDRPRRALRGR